MDNYSTPNPFASIFTPTVITIMVIFGIIELVAMWKIFTKAGQPGWASIIPIYNIYVLTVIIGKPWWWMLLLIVPCVSLVFAVWMVNLLSKSFGQGVGFTLGMLFLGFIFYPILAFGDYTYQGPGGAPIVFGAGDYEKPFDINS